MNRFRLPSRFFPAVARTASWLLLALLVWQCAQPLSPDGGPRDKTPPVVAQSNPDNKSLFFEGDEVKIVFSETVRKPTYDKEIFVSPFIKRPQIILADNGKRFRIKFEETLRPSTTYVITLTDIRDASEGNKMEETYFLAFSTGDQLDSMEIKGRIQAPKVGNAVKDLTVMLFDADDAINQDFADLRPAYLTKSDENGAFSFQYLRRTEYRILAIQDGNQTNSYTPPIELVATAADTLIRFPDDSTNLATVVLFSYLPDIDPPRLQECEWINDSSLVCRFNENLWLDSMQVWVSDTLGQDSVPITDYSWYRAKDPELLLHLPRPSSLLSQIHFTNLRDSLRQTSDTITLLSPNAQREWKEPLLIKPELKPELDAWVMTVGKRILPSDTIFFALTDTAKVDSNRIIFPFSWTIDGFRLLLRPEPAPDSLGPMVLRVQGTMLEDTALQDSIFSYPLKWFDPTTFAKLAGTLRLDSSYQGPIVLNLLDTKDKVIRTVYDTTFSFRRLKPDTYHFQLIVDRDSNQSWSPGQLYPPRLPEKIYDSPETIELTADFDFEDHLVEMNLPELEASAIRKAAAAQQAKEAKEKGGGPESTTGGKAGGGVPAGGPPGRQRQ